MGFTERRPSPGAMRAGLSALCSSTGPSRPSTGPRVLPCRIRTARTGGCIARKAQSPGSKISGRAAWRTGGPTCGWTPTSRRSCTARLSRLPDRVRRLRRAVRCESGGDRLRGASTGGGGERGFRLPGGGQAQGHSRPAAGEGQPARAREPTYGSAGPHEAPRAHNAAFNLPVADEIPPDVEARGTLNAQRRADTLVVVVLGGELAVPCNRQPAPAGLNPHPRLVRRPGRPTPSGVDGLVLRGSDS